MSKALLTYGNLRAISVNILTDLRDI